MVNQGDIIMLDFNPGSGHEQTGFRPAVVVSNDTFNKMTQMTMVCPVTNTDKDFPTHVRLDDKTETTGVVLCEHIKSLDLSSRTFKFKERIPSYILDEILDLLISEIEIEK